MLKNSLLVVGIFFISAITISQSFKGDLYVSGKTGYLDLKSFDPRMAYGIQVDYMIKDNIGLHWNILGGNTYFRCNASVVGGIATALFLVRSNNTGSKTLGEIGTVLLLGGLLALLPEGISYEANLGRRFSVAPYISPLQYDIIANRGQKNNVGYVGGGVGIMFNKYAMINRLKISLQSEYKIHYNQSPHPGFFISGSIGYRLRRKSAMSAEDEFY